MSSINEITFGNFTIFSEKLNRPNTIAMQILVQLVNENKCSVYAIDIFLSSNKHCICSFLFLFLFFILFYSIFFRCMNL